MTHKPNWSTWPVRQATIIAGPARCQQPSPEFTEAYERSFDAQSAADLDLVRAVITTPGGPTSVSRRLALAALDRLEKRMRGEK